MTPIEVVNERHTGAKGECGHFVAHSLLLAEGESGLPRESILPYDLSVIRPICHGLCRLRVVTFVDFPFLYLR